MPDQEISLKPQEMRRRVEALDWSCSPLGPAGAWPAALVTLVELVLNASQPMFLAWGAERRWIYNDAFIAIAGDKHPDSLGRPASEVWSEAWGDLEPLFDRVFGGEPVAMSGFRLTLLRRGRLENADFEFSYTPVRAEPGGPVLGLFGVCTETSSHVASGRRQLAMAERERARILELSRDLFAVASFEGRLLSINPAWAAQLGWTEADLLGRPFASFIHADDLPETGRVVEALMAGLPVHQFHVRLLRADGSAVAYAWSAVAELDPANGTFYTVGRDITDERAAAAELEAAQEALRQSQKMEAVGQLTGGLAHDFNNLLGGIGASLQVLQARIERGRTDGLERYIHMGQDAVRRAASLTHRLLAFSRRQTLDPKPVDVNRLVGDMEALLRGSVGPDVEVKVAGVGGLWHVKVDASQLENSLLNLCINARDAMQPGGGRLTIETANRLFDERSAREFGLAPGPYISICVTDTGAGMSPEVRSRAFDPFFTTKPLGQGTGLGLSMVYGFVRQSGGQVGIDSEPGRGTTVCMHLPRHVGDAVADMAEIARGPIEPGDGETVVLIEDEPTIRLLVTEVLQDAGYRVIAAEDGQTGLAILQEEGRVDLLVTDVGLPGGLNGRQVADAARVGRPGLKVLFITGYAENAAVGNGLMAQGMEVLTKPFEIAVLASKVRGMLES
jgi:PAS domain S-box-containing protein